MYFRRVSGYILKSKRKRAKAEHLISCPKTADFKQQVIRPWLEQLPDVDVGGVYFPKSKTPFKRDSKLPVESNPLFNEFRNYLCLGPDPYELLETFKQKAGEYWSKRDDLRITIKGFLKNLGFSELYYGSILSVLLSRAIGEERDWLDMELPYRRFPNGVYRSPGWDEAHRKNQILRARINGPPCSTNVKEILAIVDELRDWKEKIRKSLDDYLHQTWPTSKRS